MKLFSKTYIHDKAVLLLLSINTILVFIWTIVVSLRLSAGNGNDVYFVQYRPTLGGLAEYQQGSSLDVLSFVGFMWLILVAVVLLSAKSYHMKRLLSLMVLAIGIMLALFTMIVSNALLVLH